MRITSPITTTRTTNFLSLFTAGYLALAPPISGFKQQNQPSNQEQILLRKGATIYLKHQDELEQFATEYFQFNLPLAPITQYSNRFAELIPCGSPAIRIENPLFEQSPLFNLNEQDREALAFFIQSARDTDYSNTSFPTNLATSPSTTTPLERLIGSSTLNSITPRESSNNIPVNGGNIPLSDFIPFLYTLAQNVSPQAATSNPYREHQREVKFVDAEQLVESMLPLVRNAYLDNLDVMMFVDRGAHSAAIGVQELLNLLDLPTAPQVMNFKFCGYDKIMAALSNCPGTESTTPEDALSLLVSSLSNKYSALGPNIKVRGFDDWVTNGSTRQVFIDAMTRLGISVTPSDFVGLIDTPASDAPESAIALLATDFTPNTGPNTWRDILEFHGRQLEIGVTYGIDENTTNPNWLFTQTDITNSRHAYTLEPNQHYTKSEIDNITRDLTTKYAIIGRHNPANDYQEIRTRVEHLCNQYNQGVFTHTQLQDEITTLVPTFYTKRIKEGVHNYLVGVGGGDLENGKTRVKLYLTGSSDPQIEQRLSRFNMMDSLNA